MKNKNIEKYLINENERLNTIINELEKINDKQLTEIFMLNVKINNAIEYIKEELIPFGDDWCWDEFGIKDYVLELLEILGDKENE